MLRQKLAENWQWTSLGLILIFSTLFSRPLIPIDETRYLSVAWEMWQNNNFLVPHINGHPYSHKPPLLFWLIHLSWMLFGVNEWSGRLVGPLFGFGSVFLTIRMAEILWPTNKDVRLAVPFILLGTLTWALYSTLTMFDSLLTFLSLLAFLSILEIKRRKTVLPWLGLSLTIGLGILAKGPIVLLYVIPPILLAPLWSKNDQWSWGRWYGFSFISLVAGIAVALCWAIPAATAGGKEYGQEILFNQTAGRMVNAFAHSRPFYWYATLLPCLTLPWFFWLPVWRGWQKKYFDNSVRFCLSIVLPAFVLLSCVSGKQIHYILPLLPLVALLIARVATNVSDPTKYDRIPLLIFFLVLSAAFVVIPQLPLHGGDRDMLKYIPKWIAVVPFSSGLFLFVIQSDSILKSIKTVSASVLFLVILLHLGIAAPLHEIYDQTVFSDKIKTAQDQHRQVAVFPADLSDQFQFSGKLEKPLISQKSIDEMAAWCATNPQGFCLVFTKNKLFAQPYGVAGTVKQYSNGWLIFRPAKDFFASYHQVGAQSTN